MHSAEQAVSVSATAGPGILSLNKQQRATAIVAMLAAYLFALAIFWLAAFRIDFHADEAIYLSNVPISIGNDTGLVYHLTYLLGSGWHPTPAAGRLTSLALGLVLIATVTSTFQCWFPRYRQALPVLVAAVVTLSYQGIFVILRVRPELSWVVNSALVICFLAYAETTRRPVYLALSLAALLILPMNHRMSWFPCAFLVIYLPLFASRTLGWKFAISGMAAMALGAVVNVVLRAWLAGEGLQHAFMVFSTSARSPGDRDIAEFFAEVFWKSTLFLRDAAANRSWWDRLLPAHIRPFVSHFFFAGLLWAACFVLPFFAKTARARFVMAFPVFAFFLFQISGYYNATYSSIFALYGVLAALYIALEQVSWRRGLAVSLLALSLFNGLSFLATRVLNHDQATFFAVERNVREFIDQIEPTASIAYPQRLMSVGMRHPGPRTVVLCEPLRTDVDYIVVDDYDFDMYRFVPDYDQRRKDLDEALRTRPKVRSFVLPVYHNEKLYADQPTEELPPTRQGSWFFRSSVAYRTAVLAPPTHHTAQTPTAPSTR